MIRGSANNEKISEAVANEYLKCGRLLQQVSTVGSLLYGRETSISFVIKMAHAVNSNGIAKLSEIFRLYTNIRGAIKHRNGTD